MTAFNFRSLLLAAIVLSNCITWTASRHHYAHNVHQHRTRHRRQGAGLYLPASYVIPGGEGDGPWEEWGEVSPCSRTCGGGVASQNRICLQPGPEGQSQCSGGDTKYFSCQTQDCPDGSGDFRAEQCAEFSDKAFRGFKYNGVRYTKAPNPCELNCVLHGDQFYFRHKLQVIDGTRCNDESFDVCVNGRCQPVGCDMMLNSTAREDMCRECRGNGANCRTSEGIFDSQDLMNGYNDILLIPAGSTSINIEEVEPSNNYLALKAKNGTYYLNAHNHIDFPRTIMIAGALWTYERSQQGFAASDRLRCLGPTNEPLYLSLLLQDENVGIRYEYSVPNDSAPPTDKRYNWVHEEFTPCSATCGGVPDKCTLPAETGECSNYREKWFYDTTFKKCRLFYYGGCGGNENNFGTEAECENSCSELKTTTVTPATTTTTTTSRPTEPQPQPGPVEPEPRPSAPERSEFCFNAIDAGPCTNTETRYAYDSALGRCVTFQYGGCGGNQNNFPDEAYCTFHCQPIQDICQLPMLQGPCDDSLMRWFYDPTTDSCSQFTYGGCEGNDNRFESLEACENRCRTGPAPVVPTTPTTTLIVNEPPECRVPEALEDCSYSGVVWYFDPSRHECVSYSNQDAGPACRYTGTFTSQEPCERSCGAFRGIDVCSQPKDPGPCQAYVPKVYFDQSTGQCQEFVYGGCLGGANRFSSIDECTQHCQAQIVPDKCTLPAETGKCSNYREKWFYDTTFKKCRLFYYGGCGGNENNFGTEAECENSCSELKTTTVTPATTTTTTTSRPTEPQPQPGPVEPEPRPSAPERSEFCFNAIDAGPCTNTETRYAYDSALGRCVTFQYGGCGGNQNNFPDEAYCTFHCQPIQDICQLPMLQGPCEDSLMRWFYDPTTDSCSQFTYGGCEGNDNRFESLEACENRCRTGPAPVVPTTPTTTLIVNEPPECRVPEALEDCSYGGVVWYFDPSRHECMSHSNQDAGSVCRYTGTFTSQEACERSCGAFRGIDVCRQPKDPGPCQAYVPKVYFDQSTGQCHEFVYGGCLGGANRFSSIEECTQHCQAQIADPCTLPPEQGNCFLNIQQWYFDPSSDQCNQFMYTGCSGNGNRFETKGDCEARCKRPGPVTTTSTPAQQVSESECKTPSSIAPCGNNVTVFYYDSERRQCLASGIGGCGHPNSYSTEEECERRCGAFRGQDVCGAHLDPGPCRASIPKIYWDAMTGTCQEYAYGGCDGGPNRFSNVEECMKVCGDTGPARSCLQAVHTGHSCAAAPGPRWHYSVAHVDCVVFAYLGCGGNDNNFRSYAHCADVCRVSRSRGDDPNQIPLQDCTPYRQECEAIVCPFGVDRFMQGECQRCQCREDPCVRANCAQNERCEPVPMRDPATQEVVYAARCVAETNEVYECDEYVANCSRLRCEYGIQRTRLPDGCEKCSCIQVEIDCEPLREECNQLKCNYGIERVIGTDGCERCKCEENPCGRRSTCGDGERCVVQQYVNGIDPEPKFTAECRPNICQLPMLQGPCDDSLMRWFYDPTTDSCSQFTYGGCEGNDNRFESLEACENRCRTGPAPVVPTTPTTTLIVNEPPECRVPEALEDCSYSGVVWYFDPSRHECVSYSNQDAGPACRYTGTFTSQEPCERSCGAFRGIDVCSQPKDPGPCQAYVPKVYFDQSTGQCQEFVYGGCLGGANRFSSIDECTQHCQAQIDVPAAPLALPPPEPQVTASEGGAATLRCLFHGNPPPKITWTFGELRIDGNDSRYRLLSDGALEIVSLYRNDTGVYICVADNGLGVATQEIHLVVNDPVRMPVGIAGDENAVVTGELGRPLHVRCLAYGYPPPSVFWYRGGYEGVIVPYNDAVYEARGNVLLIRSLAIETLGQYTCQAYNGEGKAASWVVYVRAYMPEGFFLEHEFLVPRGTVAPRPHTRLPTTVESTTTTISTTTEVPRPLYTVPVSTRITSPFATLNIGADLRLTCEVDGFPEPDVHWTRNGAIIQPDGRITITGSTIVSRLTVARVTVADSGLYACHASNSYSSQTDTTQINVQQLVVPAKCTDNPFFANCDLIVRSKFCRHKYYSKFCCKSCVEAGQLDPQEAELQADQPLKKK